MLTLEGGITVGNALHEFQGVLTGVPQFVGQTKSLSGGGNVHAGG